MPLPRLLQHPWMDEGSGANEVMKDLIARAL